MTNFDKEMLNEFLRGLASAAIMTILLVLLCAMCGCTKTQYVPTKEYHTETIKTDSTMFISLLQTLRQIEQSRQSSSDTIIINHYERAKVNENGDTIGYESNTNTYKSTSRERELESINEILRDSVRELKAERAVAKVDSVPVPYPVERELTKWESAKMELGGVAFGGCLALGIGIVVLWLIKKKK